MDYGDQLEQIAAAAGSEPDATRLHRLFDVWWQHRLEEEPETATVLGISAGDDRWTDHSVAAVERRRREAGEPLRVLATIDRQALDHEDRLSHDAFAYQCRRQAELSRFPGDYLPVHQLGGPQQDIAFILAAMPVGRADELDDVLARLRAAPRLIDETIELLGAGLAQGVTPPRVALADVPRQIDANLPDDPTDGPLLAPFRRLPPTIPAHVAEAVRREAESIVRDEVAPALRRLREHLVGTYIPAAREATALSDLPDGEEWYRALVRSYTTTEQSPEEIHEVGLAEVRRIEAELEEVRGQIGLPGDARSFAEHLRTDPSFYFDTPEALLSAYRDIAKRIDPGLVRLFGTLPRLPFGVVPVPPEQAPSAPAAFYLPGSPTAGRAGQFFANTHELSSRPTWNMESICLHEAAPGHHLQIALAQEAEALPDFRRRALLTAYVEGWGLYAESLGEELGMYEDPYQRYGALQAEILRAIRLVVDTGMHALGWSRARAIDYFRDHSANPDHDIVVEVDRYLVLPGQALAYKMGELTIKELRAEAASRLGEAFDVRAFHDEVLRHGPLPLDLLRSVVGDWVTASAPAG